MFMDKKTAYYQDVISSQFDLEFQYKISKNPRGLFYGYYKLILKSMEWGKKFQNSWHSIEGEKIIWELTLPEFKIYYKMTVIKKRCHL